MRRWYVVVALVLWVCGIAVFLSLRSPATYSSDAVVLLSQRDLGAELNGVSAGDTGASAASEAQIALLPALLDQARTAVGRADTGSEAVLSVVAPPVGSGYRDGPLREVNVIDDDKAYAQAFATAIAETYVAVRSEVSTRDLRAAKQSVARGLADLEARGRATGRLHDQLASRLQTIETLLVMGNSRAQVLQAGTVPEQVGPRPLRAAAQGIVLGLLIGLVTALGVDRLDVRVRKPDQIVEALGLPSLAVLPRQTSRAHGAMLVQPGESGHLAEAFRELRVHAKLGLAGRERRSLMVTSAGPGEGKSFTAANLACMAAASGESVLLVDLDLRRPTIHQYFDLPRSPGLSDVLAGDIDVETAMTTLEVDGRRGEGGLRVLTAGSSVPNPGELVGSVRVGELLDRLMLRNDAWVVLDTPPVGVVPDASALVERVGGTVVVVRARTARRPELTRLREVLTGGGHRPVGVVVNDSQAGKRAYGYTAYDAPAEVPAREPATMDGQLRSPPTEVGA